MKTVEFKTKVKNRIIQIPKNISSRFSKDEEIQVIVRIEEINEEGDEFSRLSKDQFLAGYSDSDSVYDDY